MNSAQHQPMLFLGLCSRPAGCIRHRSLFVSMGQRSPLRAVLCLLVRYKGAGYTAKCVEVFAAAKHS